MALSAGTVSIGVKPDTSTFGSEIKSGILSKTQGVGESMGGMILGGLKTMAGPILAVTAAFSIKHVLEDSMHAFEDLTGQVRTMQRTVGGSVQDVSSLRGALQLSGVDVNGATAAFGRFEKNLVTASGSADKAAAMSKILGTNILDASGHVKNMNEVLPGLADKFASMPDGTEKTALAMQLFGRSGRDMLPFLNKGSEGIAELTQKAKDMGLVLDDTSVNIFAEAKKSAREFAGAIQGLKVNLGQDLTPVIDAAQNLIRNFLTPVIEHITGFLQAHRQDFLNFAQAIEKIGEGTKGFEEFLTNVSGAISSWVSGGGLQKLVTHFAESRVKMLQAIADVLPGIVESLSNAIVTALPAIVQALMTMIPTLINTAKDVFTALITAVNIVVPELLTTITDALPGIVDSIVKMLPDIIQSAISLFTGLITGLVKVVPNLLVSILDALPKILTTLLNMLPNLIDGAVQLFTGLVDALIKVLPTLLNTITDKVLPKVITTLVGLIPVLIPAAIKLFLAIVEGLAQATPKIVEAVVKLVPTLVTALLKTIPQLVSAGAQLLAGLLKGLWDNAPALIAGVASKLGNALIDSVKAIFGIKSPSRVFHEIGGFITQGLANGLTAGVGLVEDAMGAVTDATALSVSGVTVGASSVAGSRLTDAVSGATEGSRGSVAGRNVINYYAAPNESLDAEKKLIEAVERARVLGWT